ncbi:MAG: EAL domain-containing protein [Coxiellaceae bacterium]|nr:EAL domain-containing protein [Coxiellaceae bacterium]
MYKENKNISHDNIDFDAENKQFQTLINALSLVIWDVNTEGLCVSASKEWMEYTGQSSTQAEGLGWIDSLDTTNKEDFIGAYVSGVQKQNAFGCRTRVWCESDKKFVDSDLYFAPVTDAKNLVTGWICALRNIEAEQVNLEKIQLALQLTPYPMLVLDSNGVINMVNAALIELLGYSKEEIQGANLENLISMGSIDEYRKYISCSDRVSISTPSRSGKCVEVITKKSGLSKVEMKLSIIVLDGKIFKILSIQNIGASEDVANLLNLPVEKLQLEVLKRQRDLEESDAKLTESRLMYEKLYNFSPDMYMSVYPGKGIILQCNNTVVEKLHYSSKEEIIGKNIFDLYAPECHEKVRTCFEVFNETGKVENTELVAMDKYGVRVPVELKVGSIVDADGKVLYSLSCWRDISVEKQLKIEHQQYFRLDVINRATKIASNAKDLHDSLKKTIDFICEVTSWPVAQVFLVTEFDQRLLPAKIYHAPDDTYKLFLDEISAADYADHRNLPYKIYKEKKPVWIDDLSENDFFHCCDIANKLGLKSAIGFPVIVENQVIAICEFYSTKPENMKENYKHLFKVLGEQVGHVFERKRVEKQYELLTHFDAATSIPNRRFFQENLDEAISKCKEHNKKLALIYIDIDNFKKVNDSLGHSIGEQFLVEVSVMLKKVVTSIYNLARMGGDEFALIVEGANPEKESAEICKKIKSMFSNSIYIQGYEITLTLSIGISIFPEAGNDSETLLRHADLAMYRAKNLGRNQFQYFSNEINKLYQRQVLIEDHLRHAVEKDELSLVYHPLVDIDKMAVSGVEVLLRWNNGLLGNIGPQEFIPIAEEIGIMDQIGGWVITRCIEEINNLKRTYANDEFWSGFHIAVNVSACQLLSNDIVSNLNMLLERYKLDPKFFVIELTETALMENIDKASHVLSELHSAGFGIAIDDFGTGYSSMSYLKSLPFTSLKIDQSFVRDVMRDENDAAIVKTIIQMGKIMNLEIIAEGVESKEQLSFLQAHGCNYAQGYLFEKPMPIDRLLDYIKPGSLESN